jgi:hypothetical protein
MKKKGRHKVVYSGKGDAACRTIKEAEVLYDARGKKKKVILPYKTYEEMKALIDDAYDNAMIDEVVDRPTAPYRDVRRKLFPRKR